MEDSLSSVKTSSNNRLPRICTLSVGLFHRSFTSKRAADSQQVMDLIEKKSKRKRVCFSRSDLDKEKLDALCEREYLHLDEDLELSESDVVEFKDFSTGKIETRLKEVIPEYISMFGNCKGGYLIIGVRDCGTVKGCGKELSKLKIEDLVKSSCEKLKMYHLHDCFMENVSYSIVIKDVYDDSRKFSGYVLIIRVEPFCCLLFVDDPQSWIVESYNQDINIDQIKRLETHEWIQRMQKEVIDPRLELQFSKLSISDQSSHSKPVYKREGGESLLDIQKNLFGDIGGRITIKPDTLYNELCREHPEIIKQLKEHLPETEGVLILSRSWAVDVGLKRNRNAVCDALLIATNNYPQLYTVFIAEITQKDFNHSNLTAFTLNKKLVSIGGYTGKLCVIPKPLNLLKENQNRNFYWPSIAFPKTYILDNLENTNELLQSVLIALLSFKTNLSDMIGIEIFNLLTTEQYEILSKNLHKSRHLFVHGPAGSGKTVVALKIMERIANEYDCSASEILYVCENTPLRDYVRKHNLCEAVTRETFMLKTISNIRHIIIDEAQNFQGDWYKKAMKIHRAAGKTSVFWVFLDYFQSSHPYETGLPEVENQNKEFLTKVVRNAGDIYDFMKKAMTDIVNAKASDLFLKNIMERCECSHSVPGTCVVLEENLDRQKIVAYIANKCKEYLHKGYSERDIAILCNTASDVEGYKNDLIEKMRKGRLNNFKDAGSILDNCIVIDSIRRFSGLERLVVFVIHPVPVQAEIKSNILLCAASRAQTNLYVLYEKSHFVRRNYFKI
ncbi:hypothetical protein XELAEV_18012675mg [Xenopus laevis]|uniref:Schlafen AlbA-2 domain-containing protein n=1 Tax=Xenopus laevis TaxID=8355 RepID=A0A974DP79_XENLA|nr:hypothetical protein XELAEV_18012675mg [Xenopus laevis]